MNDFDAGRQLWVDRLGGLRNRIRQEVIARQLAGYVGAGMTVLDVGCGQGTQALRLAAAGCRVTGIDASPELLGRAGAEAADENLEVDLIPGRLEELARLLPNGAVFDVVCAHGLLMYLDDRAAALAALTARVAPEGRLSMTFRNGHALALRPGLRGQWSAALAAFDQSGHRSQTEPSTASKSRVPYVNDLGVRARADRLEDVERDLAAADAAMGVVDWFGVRVFNDAVPADTAVPEHDELALLLEAEDQAGRRDPYRWMGAQLHVIASRARSIGA